MRYRGKLFSFPKEAEIKAVKYGVLLLNFWKTINEIVGSYMQASNDAQMVHISFMLRINRLSFAFTRCINCAKKIERKYLTSQLPGDTAPRYYPKTPKTCISEDSETELKGVERQISWACEKNNK